MAFYSSVLAGVLRVLAALSLSVPVEGLSYCSICRDHSACLYHGQRQGCYPRPVGQVEQGEVLAAHNALRWSLANGNESRGAPGPQPPAANMRLMWYDEELAAIAQRWASQCQFKHDACRNVGRFNVGQNIYLERSTRPLKRPDWVSVTGKWFDEVTKHSGWRTSGPYRFSPVTGHFTQLGWADTFLVGCGVAELASNHQDDPVGTRWYSRLYVCNYGPAGNVVGQSMYRPGGACSLCTSTCYYGLCL